MYREHEVSHLPQFVTGVHIYDSSTLGEREREKERERSLGTKLHNGRSRATNLSIYRSIYLSMCMDTYICVCIHVCDSM
jgi:hypothetical protein